MRKRAVGAAFFVFLLPLLNSSLVFSSPLVKSVDWRDLSDKNISASGRAALQINRELWKHAETEHFIYHFRDEKEAETVYVHAESVYQWIKIFFGIAEDTWPAKCHIFIFEDKTFWQEFNKQPGGERLPGAEAYTNGSELFIYREPFYLEPQRVLAHEITHIVMHRFLKGVLPLYLNEGFAEFVSYKAIAPQADGNEYNFHTIAMIPEKNFVPPDRLALVKKYPESDEAKRFFYQESELFVRYLMLSQGPQKFHSLLERAASGFPLDQMAEEICGMNIETLSHKFKTYAVVSSQK